MLKKSEKYQTEFVKYELSFCDVIWKERLLCVNFKDKLANECLKYDKLKRYFKTIIQN